MYSAKRWSSTTGSRCQASRKSASSIARATVEWVINQYQVSTDARSGITGDPNREDELEYIVRLVGKVVRVSVKTVRMVGELAEGVRQEEWMGDLIESV